jgi:hypothetical protein
MPCWPPGAGVFELADHLVDDHRRLDLDGQVNMIPRAADALQINSGIMPAIAPDKIINLCLNLRHEHGLIQMAMPIQMQINFMEGMSALAHGKSPCEKPAKAG